MLVVYQPLFERDTCLHFHGMLPAHGRGFAGLLWHYGNCIANTTVKRWNSIWNKDKWDKDKWDKEERRWSISLCSKETLVCSFMVCFLHMAGGFAGLYSNCRHWQQLLVSIPGREWA